MNAMKVLRAASAVLVLVAASAAFAGGKTYQVTGPVVEATDAKIVVMKGKDKWEIARTPDTKVTGELAKDAKVTIEYTMTATSVDVKAAKAKAKKK